MKLQSWSLSAIRFLLRFQLLDWMRKYHTLDRVEWISRRGLLMFAPIKESKLEVTFWAWWAVLWFRRSSYLKNKLTWNCRRCSNCSNPCGLEVSFVSRSLPLALVRVSLSALPLPQHMHHFVWSLIFVHILIEPFRHLVAHCHLTVGLLFDLCYLAGHLLLLRL